MNEVKEKGRKEFKKGKERIRYVQRERKKRIERMKK